MSNLTYQERYQARRTQITVDALMRGDAGAAHQSLTTDFEYRMEQVYMTRGDAREALRAIGRYSKTIIKAVKLQRNLGTKAAAGYLRNQKVPVETAAYVLSTVRVCNNWFHN